MGTRSTVKFFEDDDLILNVYQQFDGYITGVGHELANFLKGKKVVNGFNREQTMQRGFTNGMGCLAAQYVAHVKTEIGGVYIFAPDPEHKEEYNYEVRLVDGKFVITVEGFAFSFSGSPEELLLVTAH